jgi:Fe-S-cluster-containing dehydrogenase component
MNISRRGFLQIAGLAALGLLAKPALDIVSRLNAGRTSTAKGPAATGPLTAKRLAMVVDLKACLVKEGCTDCITACHQQHNVPAFGNAKDEIKWVWKAPYEKVFPDEQNQFVGNALAGAPVLVMCNHCDSPPCIKVCPTGATWKREDGIVMIDYHRCIGCRYCMAGCPYGSRSFNWRDPRPYIKQINPDFPTRMRGVVEKCNFCEERLAKNLAPACVEACPEKALTFGDLEAPNSPVRDILASQRFIQRLPELGTKPSVYYLV